ncbi:MAG: Biotin carboxylase [Deltaproteobacteria bacterium ADurb.Bin510]|nr:MAG: Biotin carboxylase [Deltaproteobacteria bacterium ADurb.Bin510]
MKRILIANRGEIALRIIRTAREMGLETICVYSEADRDMEYLKLADEAVQIGPAPATQSYLNIDAIISAAVLWKANAIHPGYGFLSENPILPARCEEHGICFIGPSASIIRTIGNKSRTKEVARSLGIPTIPGTLHEVPDAEAAVRAAAEIGLPVMIKSLYGGGGRGMKICQDEAQLRSGFESASSEALASFGRSEIYLERYIATSRHLEVQVLADEHGTVQVLGDRECSIQRRHQKVIEEAPIPGLDQDIRADLWDWARRIITAIGFKGLATVEFLMAPGGECYFLEINGRLQVEHPVTEMVTGLDLVREQIMVAAGDRIDATPPLISGHAIECRLNAEDPTHNFIPTLGTVSRLRLPAGPGSRVDTHLFEGCSLSPHYDPLIAKLISCHASRPGAIHRMQRMLDETQICGLTTNRDFLLKLLSHEDFLAARADTGLIAQVLSQAE